MPRLFLIAFALAAVFNTALTLIVLLRGRTRSAHASADQPAASIRLADVGRAAFAVSAATAAEVLALTPFALHWFGIIHLVWIDLSVCVPAAGLAVIATRLRGRPVTGPALAVAIAALAALPIAIDAMFLTPFDLRVEQARVPVDPRRVGSEPLVVAVLADIQTTRITAFERDAVAAVMAHRPDLVLVPGDIYQGSGEWLHGERLAGFRELFRGLRAPGGVWVVPGNTDYRAGLEPILAGSQARLLQDDVVSVTVRDRKVTILGLDDIEPPDQLGARGHLAPFDTAPGDDDIRIVLVHRPRAIEHLPVDARVDLVVAGHTHGGQVSLPFLGPPLVLTPLPRHVAAGGLHALDGNLLYVSRGLGMERQQAPRIRFLTPPEVTVLTLATDGAAP